MLAYLIYVFIISMLKKYLNILCIIALCVSLKIETLTKDNLQQIKLYPDHIHHFVFFHEPTLNQLKSGLSRWGSQTDIKFYLNDCNVNKLNQCTNPESTPLLLMFNRVLIRYNGNPTNLQHIAAWIQSRIVKGTPILNNKQQLTALIQKTPNWFCFCSNYSSQKVIDQQATFMALAKTLPFLNYCIINNIQYIQELGFKGGNITYFQSNTTDRVEFSYANRLDAWQWFLKGNLLHTLPRSQSLATQRFAQKQKNMSQYLVTCDFSFTCEKFWENIKKLQFELTKEALGFNFYIAIQDQKQSFTFNLYYHLTFDMRKLPAFIHIDLKGDKPLAGHLVRHIEYTDSQFTIEKLRQFKSKVQKGELEPFYFSDEIPKSKNGFYGKGSQKFIQKVVAKNVDSVIAASQNHYLILFSALQIGCTACEKFYLQYKQMAALLVNKDVTFGLMNVNRNQIPIQQVTQLPEILLYRKDNKTHPIRMQAAHNFQHLRGFFKDNLGNQYFDPDEL